MAAAVIPALAAGVLGSRPACVVDARLALTRLGLLTVTRLAREFSIWVPQGLHRILRETRVFLADPAQLVPRVYCAPLRNLDPKAEADAIGEELSQWDRLPEEDDLASLRLHHLGERADECLMPAGLDGRLRERHEQLQSGLDRAMRASGFDLPRGATVAGCIRDAAALCAALQPYGAFVLTRMERDGEGAPALCNYLDAWGVPTSEAPPGHGPTARLLREALARSGLGPVAWAGVELAAVHVVVPGFPVLGGADKGLDEDAVARLWSRASVFWHRV